MDEEVMLEELEELAEIDSDRFTQWELEFLEIMRDKLNEDRDLSPGQVEKLQEIYEERSD